MQKTLLTIENASTVAAAIEQMLTGKSYTFYSENVIGMQSYSNQTLKPEDATSKKAVNLRVMDNSAYITVVDSYGVWSLSTDGETSIKVDDGILHIWKGNGGLPIYWRVSVEPTA